MDKLYDKISSSAPSFGDVMFNLIWYAPLIIYHFPGVGNKNVADWKIWILWIIFSFAVSVIQAVVTTNKNNINEVAKRCDELLDTIEEKK